MESGRETKDTEGNRRQMKRHTADDIVSLGVCRTREQVAALVGDGITAREIGNLDIPAEDKIYVLMGLLPRAAALKIPLGDRTFGLPEDVKNVIWSRQIDELIRSHTEIDK